MTPIIIIHPITSETGDPNHAGTSIFETFCIASTTAAEYEANMPNADEGIEEKIKKAYREKDPYGVF